MNDTIPDCKTTELSDGRIILKPYRKSDIESLYNAVRASLKEMGPWLPFAHPDYSLNETKKWVKENPKAWSSGRTYQFAIYEKTTGEQIGGCGINDIGEMKCRCNLGYWVRSDKTGQGVAVAATKLLAKWGFEVLKLKRIEIVVAVENARSLRVAEKVGAKREGVLRNRLVLHDVTHDAVMHSLIPGEV